MTDDRDIQAIIELLDNKTKSGVGRIHIDVDNNLDAEHVKEEYHHGRCDVGSVWATGKV